jgi:hypothetical protein
VITGATRGSGGRALANHLADARGKNVATTLGPTRGLGQTDDIRRALRELDAGAVGSRTDRHAYHLHLDPSPTERWTDETYAAAWSRLEEEMGLEDAPYVTVRHTTLRALEPGDNVERIRAVQGGDAVQERDGKLHVLLDHEHRVYDASRDDGSVVDLSFDLARREKVARAFEFDNGFDLVAGKHNRSVAARLDVERPEVAAAIRAAGLCDKPRPVAAMTPRERAQADRTGVSSIAVGSTVLAAWRASDDGRSFVAALREQGLRIERGTKVPVVVDDLGNINPLARLLSKAAKADGDAIRAADVTARLGDIELSRPDPLGGSRRSGPAEEGVRAAEPILATSTAPVAVEAAAPIPATTVSEAAPQPVAAGSDVPVALPAAEAPVAAPAIGGGGGGGSAAPSGDAIAPIDPNKPGDAARFLRQTAAAHARQAAAAKPRTSQLGAFHAPQPTRPQATYVQSRRPGAATETLGNLRPGRRPQRLDGPSPGARGGSERAVHGDLRRDASGRLDAGADAAARSAGAARGGGIQDRDRHQSPGEDARIAGADRGAFGRARIAERQFQAALASVAHVRLARLQELADRMDPAAAAGQDAGRARVEERRIEQQLAALPPERLAAIVQRAERLDPVAAALATSRQRVATVLGREPWPDPASRDRWEVANLAKDVVDAAVAQATAAAAEAQARQREAAARIGFLDRVARAFGRETNSILAERALAVEAERARIHADTQTGTHGRRLNAADTDAPGTVRNRKAERDRWLESREVTTAVREAHGNALVEQAIADGVPGVEALARQDLAKAREILLRQEAERAAELRAAELRLQRERTRIAGPGPAAPPQPLMLPNVT